MKALLTAIKARFDATSGGPPAVHNAAYLALGGRLYLAQAPQGATAPYCIYSMVSQVAGWTFTSAEETFRVQFSVWSQSASSVQAQDAMAAVQALFDDCKLTVTGYRHVYMHRDFSTLLREDAVDEIWWHSITDYRIMLEKTR
jgi:hypothetical protein